MKKKKDEYAPLSREEILKMNYFNFVVEAAASSCQFGRIKEVQAKGCHYERANINVIIAMPLGSGKTSSLLEIKDAVQSNVCSFPAMVGSINKEGEFIPGVILQAAGKVLFMDESNRIHEDVKDAMNNLMEQRPHPRNLGFKVKHNIRKKGKFFSLKVEGNYIHARARFSVIASTMYLKMREGGSMSDIAWFTRFIPVRFIPDMDYYEKLCRGEKILILNPQVKCIDEFVFSDYMKAVDIYWTTVRASPYYAYFEMNAFHRGALPRIFKDIERLAAFVASLENRIEITLDDFNFTMKFLPSMMSNYISCSLTEHEQKVLELYGMTEQEIADVIGISQPAVSKIIQKLKEKRLLLSTDPYI